MFNSLGNLTVSRAIAIYAYLMNKLQLVIIVLFGISPFFLKSQCWELVYEDEEERILNSLEVVDDSVIWIGGHDSLLYKSSNYGDTWLEIVTPQKNLRKVIFIDDNNGWLFYHRIFSWRTTDGGESWEETLLEEGESGTLPTQIHAADFIDAQKGWINLWRGSFQYTQDGGESWHEQYFYPDFYSRDLQFINDSVGWVIGSTGSTGSLFKTSNGGENWNLLQNGLTRFFDLFFLNENTGWIGCEDGIICKTEDGGESWEEYSFLDIIYGNSRAISFVSETLGWIGIDDNSLFNSNIAVTLDGGESWKLQNVPRAPGFFGEIWEIEMVNDTLGYAASANGGVYRYRGRPADCGPIPATLQDTTLYPLLSWPSAEGCFDGYYLQLGSTPGGAELLAQTDMDLDTFYQVVEALPDSTEVYATVLPYNHVYGAAEACQSSSFTTITCPPSPIVVDTGYCKGEYLLWGDSLIQSPGMYIFPAVRENGCDSTVVVNVVQYDDPVTPIDTAYCQGDDFYWQDSLLAGSGVYKFTYLAANGCDSTVILTLEELLLPESQLDTLLCEGQSYQGQDTTLTDEGIYYFTYPAANGCDSLVQLSLDIAPAYEMQLDTFFCEGEVFHWGDSLLEAPGLYEFAYQSSLGCDSSWQVVLELRDDVYTQIDTALVAGEPYNGVFYPNDTLLTFMYPASNGCDSIVQVQLDILSSTEAPQQAPLYWIYPNPTRDMLYIKSRSTLESVLLLNALGQYQPVVLEQGTVSMRYLPAGIYFLQLQIQGRWYVERVVVE